MADTFPKSGIELVAQNFPGFMKAMKQANNVVTQFSKTTEDTAKTAGKSTKEIEGWSKALHTVINPVTVTTAALLLLGKAFVDLGSRGAKVFDVADSFRRLAGDAGVLADVLLKDLREAARGTVSDFDLMLKANAALAGAQGEFRKEFLESLPKLLEIARVQARATGQDVDYLYQSLVTGIKRTQPLIIDNTYLVLKQKDAQESYAASLGKTVDQLTAEEKQTALLRATLEAGQQAIDILGTQALTTSEKMAAIPVAFQNATDRVAVAIQPLWDAVVTGLLNVANTISEFISTQVAPALNTLARFITEIIAVIGPGVQAIWNFVQPIFQAIITIIGQVVSFIGTQVKQFFMGGFHMVGALAGGMQRAYTELIQPLVISIAEFIASFLSGESPPPLGPLSDIDKGGANTMQAWLDGFVGVALDPVEAVAEQVRIMMGDIANMGLEAVEMRLAQLDAQLQPFINRVEILKARFDALNEPAKLAFEAIDRQMEQALAALSQGDTQAAETIRQLDAQRASLESVVNAQQDIVDNAQIQLALAQAQQQEERTLLEIRKATLPVQEKATKEIQKASKTKKATGGAAPKVPKATGKAEPIADTGIEGGVTPLTPEQVAAQDLEGLIPPDEVPLGIGEEISQQVLDGWLQGIGGMEGATKFTEGQNRLNAAMEKIGSSSLVQKFTDAFADLPTTIQDNLITPVENAVKDIVNFFTGTEEGTLRYTFENLGTSISTWVGDVSTWFYDNIGIHIETGIADVNKWLNGTDPGTLGGAFSSIGTSVSGWIGDASVWFQTNITDHITKFVDDVKRLLSGEGEGSLGAIFSTIGANISLWVSDAKDWFENNIGKYIWGEDGFLTRFSNWLTNPTTEGGLANILSNLGTNITSWLQTAADAIASNPIVQTLMDGFNSIVNFLFGTEMTEEGGHTLYTAFQALTTLLPEWISGIVQTFDNNFVQPIVGEDGILQSVIDFFFDTDQEGTLAHALYTFLAGDEGTDGSIANFIQRGVDWIADLPNKIATALKGWGKSVWNNLAVPVIKVINKVIDFVGDLLYEMSQTVYDFVTSPLISSIPGVSLGVGQISAPNRGQFPTGKLSAELPGFLAGAATGGLFSGGLLRVGEQGQELIASASKMAVFPNRMVNAMESLAGVMAQPVPMPVGAGMGGNSSVDNSRSLTINGGMGGDATDERRLLAHLMAFFEGY